LMWDGSAVMDERELVGLLYRADWTRLSLTGSVRGAAGAVRWVFGRGEYWGYGTEVPVPGVPVTHLSGFEVDTTLDVAPGARFRVTSSDGQWTGGCDGTRVWQTVPELPRESETGFRAKPQPPVARLLAPSWLLSGHTLAMEGTAMVCGRPGVVVSAIPERFAARRGRLGGDAPWAEQRWRREGKYQRVVAVVDAALGFLLRCELEFADSDTAVTEFVSLTVGAETDPSAFTAPPGSILGDGTPEPDDHLGGILAKQGLEAAKTVAGLAAGGLGAFLRYGPGSRVDPFERATAEAADPDSVISADEPLPGWATGGAGPDGPGSGSGPMPVSDEVLHLLYRGGVELAPFTATLHEWFDGAALYATVPPSARRAGFGGVGFLVDAITRRSDLDESTLHTVHEVRVGGWERYRIDLMPPVPGSLAAHRMAYHPTALTIACDGSRCWQVDKDQVKVSGATSRHNPAGDLADGSWLLGCLLGDGGEVVVDGRPGYQVIAVARPGAVPPEPLAWLTGAWLPAVAVVDAATGRLLRLTRYTGGRRGKRLEFRSLSDGGPDDFAFTPPDGLPVDDKSEQAFSDDCDDPEPGPGPSEGSSRDRPRTAADEVRHQVDATVAAARGFFGSFRGGQSSGGPTG
jgi:hypothetical protein